MRGHRKFARSGRTKALGIDTRAERGRNSASKTKEKEKMAWSTTALA